MPSRRSRAGPGITLRKNTTSLPIENVVELNLIEGEGILVTPVFDREHGWVDVTFQATNTPATDRHVGVTGADTIPDELDDKILVTSPISKTIEGAGGDEKLRITHGGSHSFPDITGVISDAQHGTRSGDLHLVYALADGSRPFTGKQDFQAGLRVDAIEELTPDAGVTMEDMLFKDGSVQVAAGVSKGIKDSDGHLVVATNQRYLYHTDGSKVLEWGIGSYYDVGAFSYIGAVAPLGGIAIVDGASACLGYFSYTRPAAANEDDDEGYLRFLINADEYARLRVIARDVFAEDGALVFQVRDGGSLTDILALETSGAAVTGDLSVSQVLTVGSNTDIGGHVAIGLDAGSPLSEQLVRVVENVTNSPYYGLDFSGLYVRPQMTLTYSRTDSDVGIGGYMLIVPAGYTEQEADGLNFGAWTSGGGTVTTMFAVKGGRTYIGAGATINGTTHGAFVADSPVRAGPPTLVLNIAESVGLLVKNQGYSGIDVAYGIHVFNQSGADENYLARLEGATVDNLLVDAGDPTANETALTAAVNNGAVVARRFEVGDADSGGVGYRMLRVLN